MSLFITFFIFFHTVFLLQEPDVKTLRQLFYEARDNQAKADQLFDIMEKYEGTEGIKLSYKAGAYALKAKNGANPLSKLKNVKKSQQFFSEAVKRDPENLEIRFMRYAVEVQTPDFLGYSQHVQEDKGKLLKGLREYPKSGFDAETAKITRDFMQQFCACSEDEKTFVNQLKI